MPYLSAPPNVEPIAVIGLAFRLPDDAVSPENFWEMIMEKRCCSKKFPKDRMNIDAFHHPDPGRTDSTPITSGHFVQGDLAEFDGAFFNLTAAEASAIDPQQRIGLETAYQALENAGLPLEKIIGSKTSVYSGAAHQDYSSISQQDQMTSAKYTALGIDSSLFANRISHFFDFRGPSLHVETACSSSLMALHLSCQSLWDGSSNMSLTASSNLILSPGSVIALSNLGLLSPDGRCYSFDERANGYARGEGSVAIVTKRLTDAIRDEDTIRAVIRSTGANSDGHTPTLTQPSMESQEKLIKETYLKAGLDFVTTRFVEAHGTGTAVGDPIEASAVGAVFGKHRSSEQPLYIGSVKSNIGHLEGTSGIAALVKTILALEKGIIPPNANFERLNPKIDAEYLNIAVPQAPIPWPTDALRRASISSFGFGGSNCHVVIEDAYNHLRLGNLDANHSTVEKPPSEKELDSRWKTIVPRPSLSNGSDPILEPTTIAHTTEPNLQPRLLVWSSSDKQGMSRLATFYAQYFQQLDSKRGDQSYLDNVAYTLGARRSRLQWKSFVVADSLPNINLETLMSKPLFSATKPLLGFVFGGQGAQWYAMGRELLDYPVFRRSLQDASIYLRTLGCRWSALDELLKTKDDSRINEPELSQALCTALQIGLVELLASFNILPSAVVGHSSGEIAAAYAAHFISRRSAWRLAYYRGTLASTLTGPTYQAKSRTMMSVGLSEVQIQPYFEKVAFKFGELEVVIACVNSPKNVTVSGLEFQIDFLKSILDEDKIFARKLIVPVAYHSPQMNDIAGDYLEAIGDLEMGEKGSSNPAMISSVTGRRVYAKDVIQAEYWKNNMVSLVKFSKALSKICARSPLKPKKLDGSHRSSVNVTELVEIGPHSALQGPIRDILISIGRQNDVGYSSLLKRKMSAKTSTLEAVGRLHCSGYPVKLSSVNCYDDEDKTSNQPKVLVDLPSYPFNHSQKYWHESRLSSSGYRFRHHGRHDLLGTPVPDWNPLEPMWRNIIRVSELPWVEDHKVEGKILYPGAGILVMAIEAAKQVADPNRGVEGYNLKDVLFHTELGIPTSSEGVETRFCMTALRDSSSKDVGWFEFRLYSNDGDKWIEHSQGYIQIDYHEQGSTSIGSSNEKSEKATQHTQTYRTGRAACNISVSTNFMYQMGSGYNFGPAFHRLTNVASGGIGYAAADISLYPWGGDQQAPYAQPHVIHPTSFDGVFQSTIVALSGGEATHIPVLLPTRVNKIWVSNFGLHYPGADKVGVYTRSKLVGYRGALSSLIVVDDNEQLRLYMEGLESTTAGGNAQNKLDQNSETNLCFRMNWKPDLDLLGRLQLQNYFVNDRATNTTRSKFLKEVDILINGFIVRALDNIDRQERQTFKPHLQKYLDWMRGQAAKVKLDQSWQLSNDSYNLLADRIQKGSGYGNIIVSVGRGLSEILSGEVDPVHLIDRNEQKEEMSSEESSLISIAPSVVKYLNTLAHKMPGLKILAVGAETVHISKEVLQNLSSDTNGKASTPRYSLYTFGGTSKCSIQKAQTTLLGFSRVEFKELDIEQDPEIQGFEIPAYDVIVASSIHEANSLSQSLQNVRKILKPNGKLILAEEMNMDCVRNVFISGLLPNWWASSEDFRQWSPHISEDKWNEVLKDNGFSGIDLSVPDIIDETCQEYSIRVSTVIPESKSVFLPPEVIIVGNTSSALQSIIAKNLKERLVEAGMKAHGVLSLQETSSVAYDGDFYIFIAEVDSPLLRTLNKDTFTIIHSLLSCAKTVLWVTGCPKKEPEFGMVSGLGRVLTNEKANLKFVTLALDKPEVDIERHIGHIIQVAERIVAVSDASYEREYVEGDGVLEIARLDENPHLNQEVHNRVIPQERKVQPFGSGPPLKLSIGDVGFLDTLHFTEDIDYREPMGSGEVEIKVRAIGVNFMDCLTLLGRVNQKAFGAECSGVRALSIPSRPMSERHGRLSFKLPDSISFAQAAALPSNFTTAWHSLVEVGRIREGETILIHAGSGGTGQAAIQIAQHFGAKVFATVGTAEKKKFLMDFYNIPENHILYSRDASFALGIKRLTNDVGVDIVLNSLSGDLLVASWECMAPFGRFLEIGKKDIWSHGRLPMFPFAKNVTFSAIDLAAMSTEAHLPLLQRSFNAIMHLAAVGKLQPAQPLQVYRISEVENAFRSMQSGKNLGKMVIEIDEDDPILTILDTRPTYTFEHDASYVISGGLGGLGRSIARWMAGRGAKNLILLSRSGARSDQAKSLVEELEGNGIVVATPACDIAEESILQSTLKDCLKTMPPIKGCIQASMALEDATFENLTYENWSRSIRPKVHGSWNLHRLLPEHLDFFIMLSSISGIYGSPGQSNYAAGNTYQDSLAQHRVGKGQKAVSIDLGLMVAAGVVKENKELKERLSTNTIVKPVTEEELLGLLDRFCDPTCELLTDQQGQVVTGMSISKAALEKDPDRAYWLENPTFGQLKRMEDMLHGKSAASRDSMDCLAQFTSATSLTEAGAVVADALVAKLSRVLGISPEDLDYNKPIHEFGADSLVAVELRNWFSRDWGTEVAVFDIIGGATITTTGNLVASRSSHRQAAWSE
ncbi:hypothetical protein AJ79_07309 [Helicocarpus griseus UAMH5409]|uniref:Non-reducing polyketide synthase nscA n=1 Tax=Helicocarpus griseus UAMH5409 TaxID=1447875 RepID=A0A2B7X4L8_9EURO|nr:hypothetical protein AJ79_07309 [Helicocarpus griseus UAMH5409]